MIQSIASSYNLPPATGKTSGNNMVNKDDFLKLLVTQLQKQDPLNPSDPTEFTAQLAQFSSLEQLIGVNNNLTGLASQDSLASRMNAASLIGKTVTVKGTNLAVSSGKASAVHYDLTQASANTSVNIYDVAGNLVDVVTLGQQASGGHDFQWNGLTSSGAKAPDGNYKYEVIAADAQGQRLAVSGTAVGQVTGVSFDADGTTKLEVGGASYTMADVVGIKQ